MTSSRADRLRRFILSAFLITAASGAEAQQAQAPRELLAPADQGGAPRRLSPAPVPVVPSAPAVQVRPTTPPGVRRTEGIQVDSLKSVDPESLGALNRSEGGLGAEMWRGTNRREAIRLVAGLPDRPKSRVLRALTSRILLSRALVPPSAPDEEVGSLLGARAQKLIGMGDVEEARTLLAVTPQQGRPTEMDAADARLQVLFYNNARACGLARTLQESTLDDFTQRLLIHCNALESKLAEMSLGISMLRETAGDDPVMTTLAEAVATGRKNVVIDAVPEPKPIHLALSRAAGVTLPADVVKTDDPLVLYAATQAPNLPLGIRIDAAERGVDLGAIPIEILRRLYGEVRFSPEDKANALSRADIIGGNGARTLLFQAAQAQSVPVAQAEIFTKAIEAAREDGRYYPAVLAFRPTLDAIPPSPEMLWFAVTAVRAYLALGDADNVTKWLALLRVSAGLRDESRLAVRRLAPMARVLGASEGTASLDEVLKDWREAAVEQPGLLAAQPLLNGMLMALGDTLPASAWDGVGNGKAAPVPMPAPDLWFRFRAKSAALERGINPEAAVLAGRGGLAEPVSVAGLAATDGGKAGVAAPLLLGLSLLGNAKPTQMAPAVVYEVVRVLMAAGETRSARLLATETLLAAGL